MARFELTTQELFQLIDWTLAVKARIPKKYHRQLDRLLNAYREVLYTHRITLSAGELALHWQCAVADLPKILYLMTHRSKGRVTYRIDPSTLGLGTTVQVRFDVTLGDRQHDATATAHEPLTELETLVRQGMAGDHSVLPALRELLDTRPDLWQALDTLVDRVRQAWLQRLAGTDLVAQEIVTRQLQALQAEVAGPYATPLERLLIERIAVCWLQMQQADLTAVQMLAKRSPVQEAWVQQRQDRAQGRLLMAIKALAQVRKLLRPGATVQVNIAQQMNVG